MGLDPLSFLLGTAIGAGAGAGATYGILRNRLNPTTETEDETLPVPSKASAQQLYQSDMQTYLEKYHLVGDLIPLTRLLVEPRLLMETPPILADDDDPFALGPSRVIPRIHEFPEIYAAYNLDMLPLEDLGVCDPHIAILGIPGIGKSTALAAIGLIALGKLDYNTMSEIMDQAMESEYEGLSPEERQRRKNEFEQVKLRAADQLREAQRRKIAEGVLIPRVDLRDLMPIFIHIGDIELDLNLYGLEVDSAEPIVQACRKYLSKTAWDMSAQLIYQTLDDGQALVLIDGYDELPPSEQARVYPWLEQFMRDYGKNRIVITGPAVGYDALTRLGFIPAFIKPWSPQDTDAAVQNWQDAWAWLQLKGKKVKGKRDELAIEPQILRRMTVDIRHRLPLEITLKIWAALNADERELGRRGWFESFVRHHSPELAQTPIILREIAMVMLDRGIWLKREQITEIATNHLTDSNDKPVTNIDEFVNNVMSSGLIVERANNLYDFRHFHVMAYLAAERIINDMPQRLEEIANVSQWSYALSFVGAALDLTPAVVKRLQSPPDLLFSNLFAIARWIPDAPANSPWVSEILKKFSGAMLAPAQFPTVRARALAALIASRDPNAVFILRQGIRNGNPLIRQLACIGLGAVAQEDAINDLRPMLVDDSTEVQLAAGLALGAIATKESLEVMVQGLLEGDDVLRQAVAEALASIPGEGHNILKDGVEYDDVKVRRAAVFGLARIPAGWALVLLYRAMLEDAEWYVRTAAQVAFTQARDPDRPGLHAFPSLNQLPWLADLAATMGEAVPEGDKALQLLVRILQQAQPPFRARAAQTIGYLGHLSLVKPLYNALGDQEESVRIAAYQALSDLQVQVTTPLPGLL